MDGVLMSLTQIGANMRKELIGRLLGYIYGLEVHPGPLNSMRWQPVAAAFYALKGGDPNTKAFRHGLKPC
jgi:hypothetical protein